MDGATIERDALLAYVTRVGGREARQRLQINAETLVGLLFDGQPPGPRTAMLWRRAIGAPALERPRETEAPERRMDLREWWARYCVRRGLDRPRQVEGAELLGIGIGYFRLMLCGASPVSAAVAEGVDGLLKEARARNREIWTPLREAGIATSQWPEVARAAWVLDEIVERWREFEGAPEPEDVERWAALLAAIEPGSAHRMYKGVAQLAGASLPGLIARADEVRAEDELRAQLRERRREEAARATETLAPKANAWGDIARQWVDEHRDREFLDLAEVAAAVGADKNRAQSFVALALARAGWLPQRPNAEHAGAWFTPPV